jgi:hypothetical protein
MKKILALFLALICFAATAETPKELRHLVILKLKADATPEQIKNVEDAFRDLKNKIPQVISLEWGTNVSTEQRNKGFTHCFLLSFKNEDDLKTYIAHPAHKAFGSVLKPVKDDVFVLDFWSQK